MTVVNMGRRGLAEVVRPVLRNRVNSSDSRFRFYDNWTFLKSAHVFTCSCPDHGTWPHQLKETWYPRILGRTTHVTKWKFINVRARRDFLLKMFEIRDEFLSPFSCLASFFEKCLLSCTHPSLMWITFRKKSCFNFLFVCTLIKCTAECWIVVPFSLF